MTPGEQRLLDDNLKNFDSFIELHKFLFSHDIELSHEEWEECRDRFLGIVAFKKTNTPSGELVVVERGGIIFPDIN
jgi:hypothetical protein